MHTYTYTATVIDREVLYTVVLTATEQVVADLRATGITQREVAEQLGISRRTVELHCMRIARKTGAKPRRGKALYVYFIRSANGLINIGHAADWKQRLTMLTVASPVELKLIRSRRCQDPIRLERELQERFKAQRVRGEWFTESPELLQAIEAL